MRVFTKGGILAAAAVMAMSCPIKADAETINTLYAGRESVEYKESKWIEAHGFREDPEIPDDVEMYADIYGREYNICPEFLEATMEHESQFETLAVHDSSIDYSVGPAQVNLKCSYHYDRMEKLGLTVEDLNTYEGAMYFMADLFCELFEDYEDPAEVLMRYNGDKTNLRKYWKTGEMSDYASEILERSMELERRHGK